MWIILSQHPLKLTCNPLHSPSFHCSFLLGISDKIRRVGYTHTPPLAPPTFCLPVLPRELRSNHPTSSGPAMLLCSTQNKGEVVQRSLTALRRPKPQNLQILCLQNHLWGTSEAGWFCPRWLRPRWSTSDPCIPHHRRYFSSGINRILTSCSWALTKPSCKTVARPLPTDWQGCKCWWPLPKKKNNMATPFMTVPEKIELANSTTTGYPLAGQSTGDHGYKPMKARTW